MYNTTCRSSCQVKNNASDKVFLGGEREREMFSTDKNNNKLHILESKKLGKRYVFETRYLRKKVAVTRFLLAAATPADGSSSAKATVFFDVVKALQFYKELLKKGYSVIPSDVENKA